MREKAVSTVVKMDNQGRVRIPLPVREALGVKESSALLEIIVKVVGEEQENAKASL